MLNFHDLTGSLVIVVTTGGLITLFGAFLGLLIIRIGHTEEDLTVSGPTTGAEQRPAFRQAA